MSVKTANNSHYLTTTLASALTIGTGDFSIGFWLNLYATPTFGSEAILGIYDAKPPSSDPYRVFFRTASGNAAAINVMMESTTTTEYTYATSTWYYVVISRSGGSTLKHRIFDDSSSTTPLDSQTITRSDNMTTFDTVVVGNANIGNGGGDRCLFQSLKIYTGAEWSDAEAREESRTYAIQKTGGTDRLCWKLTTINADTDGLNEIGGAGPNFTNSGAVTDAAAPSCLSSPPAGRPAWRNVTRVADRAIAVARW